MPFSYPVIIIFERHKKTYYKYNYFYGKLEQEPKYRTPKQNRDNQCCQHVLLAKLSKPFYHIHSFIKV